MSIYSGSTEIKKIYLGGNITDMQGPCPTGFHVPTIIEWNTILNYYLYAKYGRNIDINTLISYADWTNGGYNGAELCNYLLLPRAGALNAGDGTHIQAGTYGYYWSSGSENSTNFNSGGCLRIRNQNEFTTSAYYRAGNGANIRPFKDISVTPDSNWVALYSDKIYHNSTLGLISISSDGTNWITIADKNLGATTVYNDGDTLSESNCGKFYQRGNCYGFSYTGATITSSTKVDASTYGPGNYYSNNTFITDSTNNYWDSSRNDDLRGGASGAAKEVKEVYVGTTKVRPYNKELCFTANTANSTVKLTKNGSPASVSLEKSTDGSTWSNYTVNTTITLSNIGDKVYLRNKSGTTTGFSTAYDTYYKFAMTGSIAASGDITTLLNKNGTNTLSQWCFSNLFSGCSALTKAPELPATTLADGCYYYMFHNCTNLTTVPQLPATTLYASCYQNMFYYCSSLAQLPKLPATTLTNSCYREMFSACSGIKLSTSKTGAYQTPYRIPTTGTGTTASYSLYYMFNSTGGTFTGTPSINTTYYTSNTLV